MIAQAVVEIQSGFLKVPNSVIEVLLSFPEKGPRLLSMFCLLRKRAVFHGQKNIRRIKMGNTIRPLRVGEAFFTQTEMAKFFSVHPRTIKRDLDCLEMALQDIVPLSLETNDMIKSGGTIMTFWDMKLKPRSNQSQEGQELEKNLSKSTGAESLSDEGEPKDIKNKEENKDGAESLSAKAPTIEDEKIGKYINNNQPTKTNLIQINDHIDRERQAESEKRDLLEHVRKCFPDLILNLSTFNQHMSGKTSAELESIRKLCDRASSDLLMSLSVRGIGSIMNYPQLEKQAQGWRKTIEKALTHCQSAHEKETALLGFRDQLKNCYQPFREISLTELTAYFMKLAPIWPDSECEKPSAKSDQQDGCPTHKEEQMQGEMDKERRWIWTQSIPIERNKLNQFMLKLMPKLRPSSKSQILKIGADRDTFINHLKKDPSLRIEAERLVREWKV